MCRCATMASVTSLACSPSIPSSRLQRSAQNPRNPQRARQTGARRWTSRQVESHTLEEALKEIKLTYHVGAGPGPQTVLRERSLQHPLPRSRSPLKTNLQSPARKSALFDRNSSPDRDATVTRRLNFAASASAPKRGPGRPAKSDTNGLNGKSFPAQPVEEEEEEDEEEDGVYYGDHPATDDMVEQSLQMVEEMASDSDNENPAVGDDDEQFFVPRSGGSARNRAQRRHRNALASEEPPEDVEPAEEPAEESAEGPEEMSQSEEEEAEVQRPPSEPEEEVELPPPKRRGRPKAQNSSTQDAQRPDKTKQKPRPSKKRPSPVAEEPGSEEPSEDDDGHQAKRQRKTKASPGRSTKEQAASTDKPPTKGRRGRPPKAQKLADEEDAGESSFMALQKGPPLPKGRGLVSLHYDDDIKQTRSGRHSFRPLAFWRGEMAVPEHEATDDALQKDKRFIVPSYKEVVRVPMDVLPSKRAPKSKSRAKTKSRTEAEEEDEELEEWEMNPGTVTGEVVIWEPEHEFHPPAEDEAVHLAEEQIAISGDAVQTRDIKDATFRFGKTLTMPFMGAGVVDLPPGAEKRPKNSRKMHMVFFVHYGKVLVTVNEAQFRISPGGSWFVPRGMFHRRCSNPFLFILLKCSCPTELTFVDKKKGTTTPSSTITRCRRASSSPRPVRWPRNRSTWAPVMHSDRYDCYAELFSNCVDVRRRKAQVS